MTACSVTCLILIQTAMALTMATTNTLWRRQPPSTSMSRLRSTLLALPSGRTASSQSINTLFLSRFSALDSAPHFRPFLQSGCGSSSSPWKSLVYIPTAAYCLDKRSSRPVGEQRRRARYDAKQKAALLSQAFGTSECNLLELDAANISEEVVATRLTGADVVYVDGGNTFYLQRHMIESQFWSALETSQFASRGGLYVGASAGAIVAGQSIKTAYWKGWDDPAVAGDDFEWTEDALRGRGLRDYSTFMHYVDEQHAELVQQRAGQLDHPVKVVADDVALVHLAQRGEDAYTFYSDGRRDEDLA